MWHLFAGIRQNQPVPSQPYRVLSPFCTKGLESRVATLKPDCPTIEVPRISAQGRFSSIQRSWFRRSSTAVLVTPLSWSDFRDYRGDVGGWAVSFTVSTYCWVSRVSGPFFQRTGASPEKTGPLPEMTGCEVRLVGL